MVVLLSFFSQLLFNIFGSRRKFTRNSFIYLLVWLAYLIAEWAATFALGSLASINHQGTDLSKQKQLVQAVWAPLLLLHLGYPYAITAYSLEDNELWLRNSFKILVQVFVVIYVFIRSWNDMETDNISGFRVISIHIPLLIARIISSAVRIVALRSSSTKHLKNSLRPAPDPGLTHAKNTSSVNMPEEHEEIHQGRFSYLFEAHCLFEQLKHLYVDLILSNKERNRAFKIINKENLGENGFKLSFKLVAVELGLMYDLLYTKASFITQSGMLLYSFFISCPLYALTYFSTISDTREYPVIDIRITYVLLNGALLLEACALTALVHSDWRSLRLSKHKILGLPWSKFDPISYYLINKNRWSKSMGQYNLLGYCLNSMSAKCIKAQKFLGIKESLENYQNLTWKDVHDELQKMIFNHLLEKGKRIQNLQPNDSYVNHLQEMLAHRGDYVLKEKYSCFDDGFSKSTIDVEFDHSLLIWHIATDICYYTDLVHHNNDNDVLPRCKISKCISDYMCYILVMCTTMLPRGIGEIRYRDTCAEAIERVFKPKRYGKFIKMTEVIDALLKLEKVGVQISDENKSKTVLLDGVEFARKLKSMQTPQPGWSAERKWEMISEVWIEMLTYAANHCEWKEHGQHLAQEGELLTHVCALMAHLGLNNQI